MTGMRTEFERRRAMQLILQERRATEAPGSGSRDSRATPELRVVPATPGEPYKFGGPRGALLAIRRREIIELLAERITSGEVREGADIHLPAADGRLCHSPVRRHAHSA
ncbi:hypothetical protein Acor_09840 [Acrocarpospora corrugata]|uniref:Uncharacterized protein n=1 Tax=Acrocarpospora corrugata TaxID=35763 RepID=A0A5M3VW06_9ACTN|nr:hypothetical protein Acor_09840 [Acrocarpospora corrugata]